MSIDEMYPIGEEVIVIDKDHTFFNVVGKVTNHVREYEPMTSKVVGVYVQFLVGEVSYFIWFRHNLLSKISIYPIPEPEAEIVVEKPKKRKIKACHMVEGSATIEEILAYPEKVVYSWIKDGRWKFRHFNKYMLIKQGGYNANI